MSTIKVNSVKNISTNDGGISIDTSGHVTVDGVALPSAGPLSNRNLIINGAMQVAQRGTSSTSIGYQTVDRFRVDWGGGVGITQSQEALTSGDPHGEGFRYFLRLTNTTTSSATGVYSQTVYYTESQDIATSGWNYTDPNSFVTISFWVRSSLAGTYYAYHTCGDVANFTYNKAFTVLANTWTKVTYSIPGHSSLVFNTDNGQGLRFSVFPHYGTDNTGATAQTDAWFTRSGSDYTPDYSQNWANTAGATFDITGVQLEVGSVATPFEHRSYGDELARCQRYYYKIDGLSDADDYGIGFNTSTTNCRPTIVFPVTMRDAPSAVETTGTATDYKVAHGGTETTCSAVPSFSGASKNNGRVVFTVSSGLTTGQGSAGRANGSNSTLAFSAEL